MEAGPPPREGLAELRAVLDLLLRRLTRRAYATPREMQVDAGRAISLLLEVRVPNGEYLASTLSGLIRELGQRRPDLLRHIVILESFLAQIDTLLDGEEPRA